MMQGPKKPPWFTNGAKKWNKGAPLTKPVQMPGIGRGKHPNSQAAWKLGCKQNVIESPRDPALPTSVPLPAAVEDISNACLRAMWDEEQGEPAPVPEGEAE